MFVSKVVELLHKIVVLLQKLRFIIFIAPKEINGSIFEIEITTKSQNINCLKFTKHGRQFKRNLKIQRK